MFNKSYIRWWWCPGIDIDKKSITTQLEWIKEKEFGGVEIAFTMNFSEPNLKPNWPLWLSSKFRDLIILTRNYATKLNLSVDITFGSLWPFGCSALSEKYSSQNFNGYSDQKIEYSWECPQSGKIVNHLDKESLHKYSQIIIKGFGKAISEKTVLFCDSWEIDINGIWDLKLWIIFKNKYDYDLNPFIYNIDEYADSVRYDYRKLLSETIITNFYSEFTKICHNINCYSRVQCHGSPTNLIDAYSTVDYPETETLLYPIPFARIAASSASLSNKNIVSCETFTCMYGFPNNNMFKEDIIDMKLLADGIIGNGVNQIIYHGMPFKGSNFYAGIYVQDDCNFVKDLPLFNKYLSKVCNVMRSGYSYHQIAIYVPFEDNIILDKLPDDKCVPGASYYWKMTQIKIPSDLEGYNPVWISGNYLKTAKLENNILKIASVYCELLYIDCEWIDFESLEIIYELAKQGLSVIIKNYNIKQPGYVKSKQFNDMLEELKSLSATKIEIKPIVQLINTNFPNILSSNLDSKLFIYNPHYNELPYFWSRIDDNKLILFFASPLCKLIQYPMKYHMIQYLPPNLYFELQINYQNMSRNIRLEFNSSESILAEISNSDTQINSLDIQQYK